MIDDSGSATEPRGGASRSVLFLLGVGAMAVAPVIAGALAFRSIGTAGRGELAVYVVVGSIAGIIGSRGLETALLSHQAAAMSSLDPGTVVNGRLLRVAVLEAPAAAFVAALIVGHLEVAAWIAVWAFSIASADYSLSKAVNLRERRTGLVLAVDLTVASLMILGAIIVFQVDGRAADYAVGLAVALLTVSVLTRAVIPARRGVHRDRQEALALQIAARPLFLSKGLVVIAFRIDRILLAVIVGLSGAGIYAAAIPIAEIVGIAPLHLAQLSTVDMSGDGAARWWRTTPAAAGLIISACVFTLIVVLADVLLDALYGSSPGNLTRTVRLLALASFMSGLWRLTEAELVARGRPRATVIPAGLAAASVVVVTAALADRFGAVAASVGSLVGYTAAFVVASVSTARARAASGVHA